MTRIAIVPPRRAQPSRADFNRAVGGPALVEFDDIEAAAARLRGVAHRTPVFRSRTLDVLTGGGVHFKAESLQRTGAFKFRGALNALSLLTDAAKAHGVLAYSSGNDAQAMALAGRELGIGVTIIIDRKSVV